MRYIGHLMKTQSPTAVIIGAGSLFFGSQAIWAFNQLEGFRGATLRLVDTNPETLKRMSDLARLVAKETGSGLMVEAFADYREALPNADFVILSFSRDNAHYRRIDCEVSAKYGIRMCSGDTIGPGGVFRAARELPLILEICQAVESICPEAWVINYVNPSSVMGIGIMRHSKVRSFALCDSHHLPGKKKSYLDLIGEPEEKMDDFDIRIAGVNHFTFMLQATLEGKDVLPRIRDAFAAKALGEKDQGYAKGRFNNFITAQLCDVFGAIPTCTGHTKEYVPYYQGRSAIQEAIPALSVFDSDERVEGTIFMHEEIERILSGEETVNDFLKRIRSDHATDIMHTMVTGDGRNYYINRSNSDAIGGGKPVGNLPGDAFLEMECEVSLSEGPRPLPVGDFPLGLRAQQMAILEVHEITVEAIVRKDKALLTRALAMDPLINSIATANAVIDELFAIQAPVLGDWSDSRRTIQLTGGKKDDSGNTPQLY